METETMTSLTSEESLRYKYTKILCVKQLNMKCIYSMSLSTYKRKLRSDTSGLIYPGVLMVCLHVHEFSVANIKPSSTFAPVNVYMLDVEK